MTLCLNLVYIVMIYYSFEHKWVKRNEKVCYDFYIQHFLSFDFHNHENKKLAQRGRTYKLQHQYLLHPKKHQTKIMKKEKKNIVTFKLEARHVQGCVSLITPS